jgi:hypothetical protein
MSIRNLQHGPTDNGRGSTWTGTYATSAWRGQGRCPTGNLQHGRTDNGQGSTWTGTSATSDGAQKPNQKGLVLAPYITYSLEGESSSTISCTTVTRSYVDPSQSLHPR